MNENSFLRLRMMCGMLFAAILLIGTPAIAQNIFPLTVSGQQEIYVDTNGNGVCDSDTDGYFTLKLVKLVSAGQDANKWAVILEGNRGLSPTNGFGQVFVLDGDVNSDGKFQIRELAIDSTYLGDNNQQVTVKNIWAHIGLADEVVPDYAGFLHSVVLEMSDPANPFSGFNKATFRVEGDADLVLGNTIDENSVTIEFNDGDYADTISFVGTIYGAEVIGNVLTNLEGAVHGTALVADGGENPAWLVQAFGMIDNELNYNDFEMFIPLGADGSIVITDGQANGFLLKSGIKLVHEASPTPGRIPGVAVAEAIAKLANYSKDSGFCMIQSMKSREEMGPVWMGLMLMLGLGAAVALRKK